MKRFGVAIAAAMLIGSGAASAAQQDTFVIQFWNDTVGANDAIAPTWNGTAWTASADSSIYGYWTVTGTLQSGTWGAGTYYLDNTAGSGQIHDTTSNPTSDAAWSFYYGNSGAVSTAGGTKSFAPKNYAQGFDNRVTTVGTAGSTSSSGIEFIATSSTNYSSLTSGGAGLNANFPTLSAVGGRGIRSST
jgi:hypothetical protein